MRWRSCLSAVFSVLAMALIAVANSAQTRDSSSDPTQTDIKKITHQIAIFAYDLEHIRRFMGVAKPGVLGIEIRNASLRDLYFQTLTTWETTNRLFFEITRLRGAPPILSSEDISIATILERLGDAHHMLRQVMGKLAITPSEQIPSETPKSLTELFNSALELNRQLNQLLERHTSPSDVHQKLTLAVSYAARLLARYPDATRIPSDPPFEPDKQPKDVYLRLIDCLQAVARIFSTLNLPVLSIDASRIHLDVLQSSDVYLLASTLISQLNVLHKRLAIDKPPPQPVYPGLKFPAHNFQRAGLLLAQLQQLERFLQQDRTISTTPVVQTQ